VLNAEEQWEHMVKLKINNNKAMKLYLSFVTDILNDKEGAQEIW